jgi:hypothetical protein
MSTKCKVLSWMEFWNSEKKRKDISEKKLEKSY